MTTPLHFLFGEPPTPPTHEQRLEHAKLVAAKLQVAVKHLREAQEALREVALAGLNTRQLAKVRHRVAAMIDDVEIGLRGGIDP